MLRWRGGTLTHWSMSAQVWHEGVRLFGFWKPEDSVMDPHDLHLKENNRLRALSNPLLLNEALLMRRRGAYKEAEMNCGEVLENDSRNAKAFFRRGQVRVDLQKWELARSDFRRALECGAVQSDVDKELHRLRKLERQQDAKDGKTLKHTFDLDRPSIYDTVSKPGVEKALRDIKEDALRRKARGPALREPVTKTSSQKNYDWTTSYTKKRPAYTTAASDDKHEPVLIQDLAAEIEDISDEEEEARRRAKQDYYNAQIALGNMRVQLPKPGEEV
jgi:tetratricopeptide (TPR) repeat protein